MRAEAAGRVIRRIISATDPYRPVMSEASLGQNLPFRIAKSPLCYNPQIEKKEKSGHAL